MERHRFEALDGLRGLAALCVVVFDAQDHLGFYRFVPHGYLAVDFFFILGGFLISHAFNERLSDHRLSVFDFWVSRLKRLAPLNVAAASIGAVLVFAAPQWLPPYLHLAHQPLWPFAVAVAASGLLLPFDIAGCDALTPLNPPAWPLFFGILVDVLYGFLARILSKSALLLICAVAALGLIVYATLAGTTDIKWTAPLTAADGLLRSTFGFSMGVLLHRLWSEGLRAPRVPLWALGLVFVGLFQVAGGLGAYRALTDLLVSLAAFPLLIWVGASASVDGMAGLARRSGAMAYPLYVLHYLPIVMACNFVDHASHSKPLKLAFLFGSIVLLALFSLRASALDARLRDAFLGTGKSAPA